MGAKPGEIVAEKTLVVPVDYLPGKDGRDWLWMPDLNVVLVSDQLGAEGLRQALEEVSIVWRRSFIKVVPCPGVVAPLAGASQAS